MQKIKKSDEVIWKDLVCKMAKQIKCSVSEISKRKRPNCSVKIRSIKLRKKWSFTKGFSYTLLQTSTWQAMAEGICTDKVAINENIFAALFTSREVLDTIAVELTLLGFDDLVKIAEQRLSRKEK
jgi:hypothetical protein